MIYTLGESLMDIIFENDGKIIAKPGGSMLNLAVSLGRCGRSVNLLSELGDDKVSEKVVSFLTKNKVGTNGIRLYQKQSGSGALAFLDKNKKPTYSIHKSYPTKRLLKLPQLLTKKDILIFGSFYSLDPEIRSQVKNFVEFAKAKLCLLIYDPNIRQAHHFDSKETFSSLRENLAIADIIKGSDEDFENIFGEFEEDFVLSEIRNMNKEATIVFTRGEEGSKVFIKNKSVKANAEKIEVVSTIGAGDNFTAGMVFYISSLPTEKRNPKNYSEEKLQEMLRTATKFSANVCQSLDNYVSHKFASSL